MLKLLFSRQWWWTTLLVLAAIGVMARLGVWQLDRLAERRAFNARVQAQLDQPPFNLTAATFTAPVYDMEYRAVTVVGRYDFAQQVALRNQVWENTLGVHLLTPLIISGTDTAVLVNRGWITATARWGDFDEPGVVTITGVLRRPQTQPDFGGVPDPAGALPVWNIVNLDRLREQISHPLLLAYIQQTPEPNRTALPHRAAVTVELSEGSHLGYALQWFLFAIVLAVGYPFYLSDTKRQVKNK